MTNYRRLISYIYAYEGEVKGRNIGFAKLESRNGQCKLSVNVKKVYVGGSDLGVYLLAPGREIFLGSIFIRGGTGEFRAAVAVDNAADSGCSMEHCYGLTIHEKGESWRAYTTIWEDAVAQAAELELASVTSENRGNADEQIHKKMEELDRELEAQEKALGEAPVTESDIEPEIIKISVKPEEDTPDMRAADTEESRKEETELQKAGTEAPMKGQAVKEIEAEAQWEKENTQTAEGITEADRMGEQKEVISQEEESVSGEPAKQASAMEVIQQEQAEKLQRNEPAGQERMPIKEQNLVVWSEANRVPEEEGLDELARDEAYTFSRTFGPAGLSESGYDPAVVSEDVSVADNAPASKRSSFAAVSSPLQDAPAADIGCPSAQERQPIVDSGEEELFLSDPQELARLEEEEQEYSQPQQVWEGFRKRYPKIQAFDSANGCEILTIKPQDIGLLPRENWNYGNNSFLLHGYYNYRYLVLARIGGEGSQIRYILGVPGHYYSNEKYMASMFGFPHFVLSKKQPSQDGRFGYWYTDIRLQNQD